MNKIKGFELFTSLTSEEWKAFEASLKKKYKTGSLPLEILIYLRQRMKKPQRSDKDFLMSIAYKKIQKEAINDKSKKVFQHAIYKLIEDLEWFLLKVKLEEDVIEKDQLLLQIYQERNQSKLFFKKADDLKKKLKNIAVPDLWHSYHSLKVRHLSYFNNYTEKIEHPQEELEELIQFLDIFYANKKIAYTSELAKNFKQNNRENKNLDIPKLIDTFSESEFLKKNRRFQLYSLCSQLSSNPSDPNFDALKDYLEEHVDSLDEFDKNLAFTQLNNTFAHFIFLGKNEYYEKMFLVFQIGIENNAYMYSGYFNPIVFQNIISTSIALSEHKWADQFIETHKSSLPDKQRDDIVHISQAYLFLWQKKFKATIDSLKDVTFHNPNYTIRSKAMILRAHFELKGNIVFLESLMDSFQVYINRQKKKFNSEQLAGYAVLIKYIRKLLKLDVDKNELLKEIEAEEYLLFRKWIVEKIEELK